jgi:hypothetical protein
MVLPLVSTDDRESARRPASLRVRRPVLESTSRGGPQDDTEGDGDDEPMTRIALGSVAKLDPAGGNAAHRASHSGA